MKMKSVMLTLLLGLVASVSGCATTCEVVAIPKLNCYPAPALPKLTEKQDAEFWQWDPVVYDVMAKREALLQNYGDQNCAVIRATQQ